MDSLEQGKATPLFRQYNALKEAYPDTILLFRLGDFYEMFGQDAVVASKILGITLTSRRLSKQEKIPMCGVPHHSASRYIRRLVEAGRTAAIADQVEDAATAKGLVKREVTRVITPGTLIEEELLDEGTSNYLVVVVTRKDAIGYAILESSGGTLYFGESPHAEIGKVASEVASRMPRELKLTSDLKAHPAFKALIVHMPREAVSEAGELPSDRDLEFFIERQFKAPARSLGIEGEAAAQAAVFEVVRTLRYNFKVDELPLTPRKLDLSAQMVLDAHTLRNLEVLEPIAAGGESLIEIFSQPKTGMGKRMLREWLRAPAREIARSNDRLDAVTWLISHTSALEDAASLLDGVADIERIANRAGLARTNPKELAALRDTLAKLPLVAESLGGGEGGETSLVAKLTEIISTPIPIAASLTETLADDPPASVSECGVVRDGFLPELDEVRKLVRGGKDWFLEYQSAERERTGVRSLKVKYTSVFGYFIEVSKANLHLVPDDYTRKQTLLNAERFTTPEISLHEAKLARAEDDQRRLEREVFDVLVGETARARDGILRIADAIAGLDVLLSFARTAGSERWARPTLSPDPGIKIEAGRHPIVERAVGRARYVANDCSLDAASDQIIVLTGPNMGGKSTYMRMIALIVLLAQAGSFVPAEAARVGIVDRIYTRVGATDALAQEMSTFMVEMVETAEILRTASGMSLVILDEVGRGTGTYDGLSIAKAVVEYLHEASRANPLTLFATHYFELTELESLLPRVKNYRMEVLKEGSDFVFLYAVKPGFADESYGIEVARLAGLPDGVIVRARRILEELEEVKHAHLKRAREVIQMGLFEEE